jgi:hypothetical protein
VDLVTGLALGDETPETYRTLQNNLEGSHFRQREPSFRWARVVDRVTVLVNVLCETRPVPSLRLAHNLVYQVFSVEMMGRLSNHELSARIHHLYALFQGECPGGDM